MKFSHRKGPTKKGKNSAESLTTTTSHKRPHEASDNDDPREAKVMRVTSPPLALPSEIIPNFLTVSPDQIGGSEVGGNEEKEDWDLF